MSIGGACRLLLTCVLLLSGATASAEQRVLFLSDFASITPGYRVMEDGIAEVLGDDFQYFYPEFLNDRDLSGDEAEITAIVDLYTKKYASTGIDVIASYGPHSEIIAQRTRDRLGDAKILRIGLSPATFDPEPQDVDLIFDADLVRIFREILGLSNPSVILFTGEMKRQPWRQREVDAFRAALVAYDFEGDLVDMINEPLIEVEQRVSTLPDGAIVVSLLWFSDGLGAPVHSYKAIDRLIASASAPVFTPLSEHVPRGATGGLVVSRELMGNGIGRALLDIENGVTSTGSMPAMRYVYNWAALEKWGLTPTNVPGDAIILNTPPQLWDTYRRQLITAGILMFLLLNALVLALLLAHQKARSKKELEQYLDELEVARKAAKIGLFRRTYGIDEMFCDERFRELFELPHHGPVTVDEANGQIHADDISTLLAETARCRDPSNDSNEYEGEFRIDRGPTLPPRWIHAQGQVHFNGDTAETFTGAVYDITEYRSAQKTRDVLIQELNHRVKNTLSVVQGLAFQTFQGAEDIERASNTFFARLAGLAAAHDLLAAARWENAEIHEIVQQTFQGAEGIRIAGPSVQLPPKLALSIAMGLHELHTNAIKYGALSKVRGIVDLEWNTSQQNGGTQLHLSWRETGGPPAKEPETLGFGMILVSKIVPKDNGGEATADFTDAGFQYHLTVPIRFEKPIAHPTGR